LGVAVAAASGVLAGGLEDLARAGRWEQMLAIIHLRESQLPLTPAEALIAAQAAGHTGDLEARMTYLEEALDDPDVGVVAALELARMLPSERGARALDLVLPVVRRAPSPELRREAVEIAVSRVGGAGGRSGRRRLERLAHRLPRSLRRRVYEGLAEAEGRVGRKRLVRILKESVADLSALRAARALEAMGLDSSRERWLVAQTLFHHADYRRAAALLDGLSRRRDVGVPAWKVRFLRGRCAFRRDRWQEAAAWYGRALQRSRKRSYRAKLLVHIARARELAGDLAGAEAAARRALATRPSDDRRLFLARLECRLGRVGTAKKILSGVRGRSARDRGRLLEAAAIRSSRPAKEVLTLLRGVHNRPWRGPALALAAEICQRRSDPDQALDLLERAARSGLDAYWRDVARSVMGRLPAPLVKSWRARQARRFATAPGFRRGRVLREWGSLEVSTGVRGRLVGAVTTELELGRVDSPEWPGRVAERLWRLGLQASAVRWDPGGFPSATAGGAAWSAEQFVALGAPRWAIRTAHGVALRLGQMTPDEVLPISLRKALYPLPLAADVRRWAGEMGVPWNLLAALVREESRWRPTALSRVGARGLTQLMPATARRIAASRGLDISDDELFDPGMSLRLGSAELGRLLKVFDGRWAPAVAAYNAGQAQARLWLASCPEPCSAEWYLLGMTFSATRTYTADVLATSRRYAELYQAEKRQP